LAPSLSFKQALYSPFSHWVCVVRHCLVELSPDQVGFLGLIPGWLTVFRVPKKPCSAALFCLYVRPFINITDSSLQSFMKLAANIRSLEVMSRLPCELLVWVLYVSLTPQGYFTILYQFMRFWIM